MLFKSIVYLALVAAAAAQTTNGKAFDHIFIVFLENTDYAKAATDAALSAFIPQGVLLDQYSGDSIAKNATRCANVVPATQLQTDLVSGKMPNYSFYTPNMINDGHNTTVADASKWLTGFLPPLLDNKTFNNNTLVVVTFDETENYNIQNRVLTILLGDAVASIKNTTDSTYNTHYSLLSTVENNWDLGDLGRQDANPTLSNVFDIVAKVSGYKNVNVTNPPLLNGADPGFLAPAPTSAPTPTAGVGGKGSGAGEVAIPKVFGVVTLLAGVFAAII
ncbi:hypothetical protein BG006_005267 [Podila minutissima]|uniref:Acid phosphatase n=1 Tax=Podila minutissima TaxID=64525 RepID=A0A9P5SK17_9FUNG|nr:hypothetical protein BG006_005267 [Podila minutissima]